ncbi:hypothetical protein Goarm_008349 [Gossypium armourianum]|uniref:Uncharacterized protein n=1 Tax=Gossypium armourianum TaxID=34283 RepID=A0A7J9JPL8_9ROSI|nr:hypothetical protein [Gossypium armourianum]
MKFEGNRFLSTSRDIPGLGSKTRESNLRPLSPHLPIYKPQLSATLSITNRISSAFLATTKAEVKNGVLKSGSSFLRRRRRGMM